MAPQDHVVQFYASDDELAAGVVPFLAEALSAGGVAIAIATAAHREAITAGLSRVAGAAGDRLVVLDADEVVRALLVDGLVAPRRFGDVIRRAAADAADRPVRAFGEVVAVLWDGGHVTAALALEDLWNGLGAEVRFSLYCAYPKESVDGDGHGGAFAALCGQHSAVVGAPAGEPHPAEPQLERARTFTGSERSTTEARRFVIDTLVVWCRADLVDDAAVVIGELAANAVLHAGTDFTVTVSSGADRTLRLAVQDASPAPPRRRQAAPLDGSGRGLSLVEALTTAWGTDALPDGKVVWAQLGGTGCLSS